jgi:hypothetical protein
MKIRKFNENEDHVRSNDIDDLKEMLSQTSSLLQDAVTFVGNNESQTHHEPEMFDDEMINKLMYDLSTLNNQLRAFLDGKSHMS